MDSRHHPATPVSFGLRPSRRPAAAPGALAVAATVVPVIIAIIVIAVRDILVRADLVNGDQWIPIIFGWLADAPWQWWVVPAGLAVIAIGIGLMVVASLPRRRTHIRLSPAEHDLWTRPVDFCRMCSATAEMVPGIMGVHSTFYGRRVIINARGGGASVEELRSRVEKAVTPLVDVLEDTPELKVNVSLLGYTPEELRDEHLSDLKRRSGK
ncbi:DUF6286 domain-containing protein [Corynebacterium ulceribovis]|uniref:DUF6286 domain-containing protein n=1 Tax=Corynebacterium ulceribovis TaxID=487732 RepID=UPI000373AE5C|nr:DUF6286 domain-containing protein [Corynebacterium ulceribovis]